MGWSLPVPVRSKTRPILQAVHFGVGYRRRLAGPVRPGGGYNRPRIAPDGVRVRVARPFELGLYRPALRALDGRRDRAAVHLGAGFRKVFR